MSARRPCSAALAVLCLAALAAGASADITQRGNLRIRYDGKLSPSRLPRHSEVGVSVSLGARIGTVDHSDPPQLTRIELAINRNGHLDPGGLPRCRLDQIQPSTTAKALAACSAAKVGEGRFYADVSAPGAAPFPSRGKLIAFNGVLGCTSSERRLRPAFEGGPTRSESNPPRESASQSFRVLSPTGRGWSSRSRTQGAKRALHVSERGRRYAKCHPRPVIFAHVYGANPLPTSYTVPFLIGRSGGAFATTLTATLPKVRGDSGHITGLDLTLHRSYRSHGKAHDYVSASCPLPPGLKIASFKLARMTFSFTGRKVDSILTRSCRASG